MFIGTHLIDMHVVSKTIHTFSFFHKQDWYSNILPLSLRYPRSTANVSSYFSYSRHEYVLCLYDLFFTIATYNGKNFH